MAATALAVGLLAGCAGLLPPAVSSLAPIVAPGTRACVGLPQATCQQQFQDAEAQAHARGTVVTGIAIRCTAVCTDASGEAERVVTYADGTSEQGGFAWQAGGPAPADKSDGPAPSLPVAPTCLGLDAVTCDARAREALEGLGPDPAVVTEIVVRCAPGPCTPTRGDGETVLTFAGGATTSVGWSYRGAP